MTVTPTTMTLAEFCQQCQGGAITIDRSYQRSPNWPAAARSFLIDTILEGYPIPKLCLAQSTDLKSRKTMKEVIDGQQRTTAILQFYEGKLRVSTRASRFAGKLFDQLEDEDKQRFLAYPISLDIFTGASPENIRELFRRINWYTAPLNAQERRHAQFAGEFKQFVSTMAGTYGQWLVDSGTLGPSQLSRMADAAFLAECLYTYLNGIDHAAEAKVDKMYDQNDNAFPMQDDAAEALAGAFQLMSNWENLKDTRLSRSYNMYSVTTAAMHCCRPSKALANFPATPFLPSDLVSDNLLRLNQALDPDTESVELASFVNACSKATNRQRPRVIRFRYFLTAMTSGNFGDLASALATEYPQLAAEHEVADED